jgi:hypothetical protein
MKIIHQKFGGLFFYSYICPNQLKINKMEKTLNIAGVQERLIEYHRKPTVAEIKFGHGATHYKTFSESACTDKNGRIKKRLKCPIDGLIYTQNYTS